MGDKTHESIERDITVEVIDSLSKKISCYINDHDINDFHVVLHGGEPSILPNYLFSGVLKALRQECGDRISISVQTNGYRIHENFLESCYEHNVKIGVSLDGPKPVNDRHRVNHNGRGSYDKIMKNVDYILSSKYSQLFQGFLCVASSQISAKEFFEWIKKLPLKNMNLLWPIDYNYKNYQEDDQELGKWLAELFEEWIIFDDKNIRIPLFLDVIAACMGSRNHTDQMVNDCMNMFVINTDGRIEYPDYFRDKGEEYVRSGLNILNDTIHDIAKDEIFRALYNLDNYLPNACKTCDVKEICGGGFLANRISERGTLVEDLSSKSVMCASHYKFYNTIKSAYNHIS